MGSNAEARAAFIEAEAGLESLVFGRWTNAARLLTETDCHTILLRREVKALLGLK